MRAGFCETALLTERSAETVICSFGDAVAETSGKNVLLNATGPFFYLDAPITFQAGISLYERKVGYITLDNVQLAAFTILHELGHRVDVLMPDRDDPDGTKSTLNNALIRTACFSDIKMDVRAR